MFENRFAKLFINLKTKFKITEAGIEFISKELFDILTTYNNSKMLKFKSLCTELNISNYQDRLVSTLDSSELVPELLEFGSNYKLIKHLKS